MPHTESEVKVSRIRLFATPWTIQSMEFSRPEYWSRLPFPSPGDLPNPGIETRSPALWEDYLPAEPQRKPPTDPTPPHSQRQEANLLQEEEKNPFF